MARYKYFDKSQGLFLTVSLEEQLIPGSIEASVAGFHEEAADVQTALDEEIVRVKQVEGGLQTALKS
jgi:hypothetical protein